MFDSSCHRASSLIRRVCAVLIGCAAILGACSAPALAGTSLLSSVSSLVSKTTGAVATVTGSVSPLVATVTGQEAATCEGESFSPALAAYGDSNEYALAPGGEFNAGEEGWQLSGGAKVVTARRPNGSTGSVLELPAGASAVSPPSCVTMRYPTARLWTQDVHSGGLLLASVSYPGTPLSIGAPQLAGELLGTQGSWSLSGALDVQPLLPDLTEGKREARFVFTATGAKSSEFYIWDLYVDPWMR
jgi:hypothetical protein